MNTYPLRRGLGSQILALIRAVSLPLVAWALAWVCPALGRLQAAVPTAPALSSDFPVLGATTAAGAPAMSPVAALKGRVHVLGSPDTVPDAVISVPAQKLRALSGARGAYHLLGPPGLWTLRVCADGYACLSRTVRLKPGQSKILDVGLTRLEVQ
ncbi:MAG: hypothetical protein ACREKE_04570, partial [bacterium]